MVGSVQGSSLSANIPSTGSIEGMGEIQTQSSQQPPPAEAAAISNVTTARQQRSTLQRLGMLLRPGRKTPPALALPSPMVVPQLFEGLPLPDLGESFDPFSQRVPQEHGVVRLPQASSTTAPSLPEVAFSGVLNINFEEGAASINTESANEINSSHIQGPPSTLSAEPEPGPVINSNGTLNKENLRCFILGIQSAIPALPAHANDRQHALHNNIYEQFSQIIQLVPDTLSGIQGAATGLDEGGIASVGEIKELGLSIRDKLAEAAKDARKLSRDFQGNHFSRHADPDKAVQFSCLASLLTELKRAHLTAVAPAIMLDHANQVVEHMEGVAKGISERQSGATFSRSTSMSVSHAMGVPDLHHGSVTVKASAGRTLIVDDDRETNFWVSYGAAIKAGGPKAWLWQAAVELGLAGGDVFFAKVELSDVVRLNTNHDANKSFQRSAGPNSRKNFSDARRGINLFKRIGLGEMLQKNISTPNYLNDNKLAKGFNFTKMHLLSVAADRHLGNDTHIADLITASYPSTKKRLGEQMAGRADEFKAPLTETVPIPEPKGHGKMPFRIANGTVSTGNEWSKVVTDHPWSGGSGAFSASADYTLMQIHVENVVAGHELLDTGYYKDVSQTFMLYRQLDALLEGPDIGKPPKLHLYEKVRSDLENRSNTLLTPVDLDFYGEQSGIPPQFGGAIIDPDNAKLQRIGASFNFLGATYLDFVENAAKIMAMPDKLFARSEMADLEQLRTDAFDAINSSVWNGRYPDMAEALKNPQAFVSQSHDALSLALGCAGTHLAVVKRQMARTPALRTEENGARIKADDAIYHQVRALFDNVYLPIKKQTLLEHATFEDRATWQRHNFAVKVGGGGGLSLNLMEAIANLKGKSLSLGDNRGSFSLASTPGQEKISVQFRYQISDKQINPSRLGQFVELTLTGQGSDPVSGKVIQEAMQKVLEKVLPASKGMVLKESLSEEAFRQLQGMVWTNAPRGMSIIIKMRRFPGTDADPKDQFDLQFIRGQVNKNSGIDFTAPIPTPVGTFSVNLAKTDSAQVTVFEVMGQDLSYLMLQHGKLTEVIDEARVHEVERGETASAALVNVLASKHQVRNGYFGTANLLPNLLDRYITYTMATPDSDGETERPDRSIALQNEFFRFNETEPFRRAARLANETRHFKPGSTMEDSTMAQKDPFAPVPENLLKRIPMPFSPALWQEEKAYISTLETVDQRVAYYSSARGRPVLDTFVEIISATRKINASALTHVAKQNYGFWTALRKN